MRGISCFFVILSITIVITGCAYHGSTVETGKPINEGYVSRIEKGKSTGADILAWFGAPTRTSRLGKEELFVYKFCKTSGSHVVVTGIGSSDSKEKCDELSVVLDAEGIVKSYGFVKAPKD